MSDAPDTLASTEALRSQLSFLPQHACDGILSRLQHAIHYEPVVGIMGKTGARNHPAKQPRWFKFSPDAAGIISCGLPERADMR